MASTLRDIARKTRLSVSSVSNILSGNDPRYSDVTRRRVLKAARDLDYHPHRAAQMMQGRRSSVIGLLLPDMSYSYFPEEAADGAGYQLLLCQTHYKSAEEGRKISLLREHRVDGLVVFPIPFQQDKELYTRLYRSKLPVVTVDSRVDGVAFDFVGTNDYKGAYMAVTHLIARGHRRIVCLAFGDDSQIRQARWRGYYDALGDVGITVDEALVIPGPWQLDAPAEELLAVFARRDRPSAIFAMSDLFGVWAYFRLRETGYAIPQDVALVGFGGLHEGKWLDTPLTTVTQKLDRMGRQAVELLLQRMRNTAAPCQQVLLDPELTIRASCGALPSARSVLTLNTPPASP